jgi:hypothetical protein
MLTEQNMTKLRLTFIFSALFLGLGTFSAAAENFWFMQADTAGNRVIYHYNSATTTTTEVKSFPGACSGYQAACGGGTYLRTDRIQSLADGDLIVRNGAGDFFRLDAKTATVSNFSMTQAQLRALDSGKATDSSSNSVWYAIPAPSSNVQDFVSQASNGAITLGSAVKVTEGAISDTSGNNVASISTTYNNAAVGKGALENNTTGSYNSANGSYTLQNNTTGSYNSANGSFALQNNTTGSYNSANGSYALQNNTTGSQNTANGFYSLNRNTTGSYNSANGSLALQNNTTGSYNSANGSYTLQNNTTGSQNTANGFYSLNRNTTGSYNSANGSLALQNNTTGSQNTAMGTAALTQNTTGDNNVAVGQAALKSNIAGSYNTAVGNYSGYTNTGSGNVFIGNNAGYNETGSNKLYIDNSATSSPLIGGDFDANTVTLNGTLTVTGRITTDEIYHSNGTKMLGIDSRGSVHLGPTSMVFTDSTVSASGADTMTSSVGRIQIGDDATDTTNVVGSFSVNGVSVLGGIEGLANGVKATTALNAAFSAVPAMSGDRQFECGIGFGRFGEKNALATSCGARLSEDITANFGASFMEGGSETYLLGDMPSVAVRAGISYKFGKSYASASTAALDGVNQTTTNSLSLSQLKQDMADAAKRTRKAEEEAASAKARAARAEQAVASMRHQLADMHQLKKTVTQLVSFINQKKNPGTLAVFQQ